MTRSLLKTSVAALALSASAAFAYTEETEAEAPLTEETELSQEEMVGSDTDVAEGETEITGTETADAEGETEMLGEDTEMADGETEMLGSDTDVAEGETEIVGGDTDVATSDTQMIEEDSDMSADGSEMMETEGDTMVTETDMVEPAIDDSIAQLSVSEIIGMNVIGETGEVLGEVDYLVRMDDALSAIVGVGGFLGLGEHEVALPLERFSLVEDALQIPDLSEDELEAMPEVDASEFDTVDPEQDLQDLM